MTERRSMLSAAAIASVLGAGSAAAQTGTAPQAARPLAGKVALVTGAARGIGRATAVELARRGADVALLDIAEPEAIPAIGYRLASREELEEAARLVRAEQARALPLVADLRDLKAMQVAVQRLRGELGGIDLLVCNAGVAVDGKLAQPAPEAWQAVLDVNLTGTMHTVWAAWPALRRPGGRVVIVTSIQARVGSESSGAYAATKWGLTGLMKSLALEAGPQGVTVNAVAPTAVDTAMMQRGAGRRGAPQPSRQQPSGGSRHGHILPVGALDPRDIAVAVAFVAGPDAASISGTTLDVNAGRSAEFTA